MFSPCCESLRDACGDRRNEGSAEEKQAICDPNEVEPKGLDSLYQSWICTSRSFKKSGLPSHAGTKGDVDEEQRRRCWVWGSCPLRRLRITFLTQKVISSKD